MFWICKTVISLLSAKCGDVKRFPSETLWINIMEQIDDFPFVILPTKEALIGWLFLWPAVQFKSGQFFKVIYW